MEILFYGQLVKRKLQIMKSEKIFLFYKALPEG